MSLTYTWNIKNLKKTDVDGISGVIVGTQWEVTGTDEDGVIGTFPGTTPFNLDEIDPENFTPYEQLTQAQVLGWIENVVVGSYREHVYGQIQKQIDVQKNPIVEVNDGTFPWDELTTKTQQPN